MSLRLYYMNLHLLFCVFEMKVQKYKNYLKSVLIQRKGDRVCVAA